MLERKELERKEKMRIAVVVAFWHALIVALLLTLTVFMSVLMIGSTFKDFYLLFVCIFLVVFISLFFYHTKNFDETYTRDED